MSWNILFLAHTFSPIWLIILDNFNISIYGFKMMWPLSLLIFFSPMTLSYLSVAHLSQSLSLDLVIYLDFVIIENHTRSWSQFQKSLFFFFITINTFFWWMGRGVWLISFCIPSSETIILTRALNTFILPLYTFSYLTYVFTPFFSLLEFFYQPLLPLRCIQIEIFVPFSLCYTFFCQSTTLIKSNSFLNVCLNLHNWTKLTDSIAVSL